MNNENIYDVVIIGSGPAGIQSCITLQNRGLKIVLIDDTSSLGGQIYKNIEKNQKIKNLFEKEYFKGVDFINKLDLSAFEYINEATVWSIDSNLNVYYSKNSISHEIVAKNVIIATGSMERPFPVNGWTLPGVISATAAQIMLKESSIFKDDAVFVGTGPLFYYVISQYLDAGAKIKAVIDTTPLNNYFKALKFLPKALLNISLLIKGLKFFRKFKKHHLKIYNFSKDIRFEGEKKLERVLFTSKNLQVEINSKIAFIHNGLAPNINLQLQTGCDYEFSYKTRTINITTNSLMESSVANVYVVGDGKSIRGAEVAIAEAQIACFGILKKFDAIDVKNFEDNLKVSRNALKSKLYIRDFLDTLYMPSQNNISPIEDDAIVCRCEEITLKDIKNSLDIDCRGPNTVKSFTRCGMGNCQARFCGLTLLEIISKNTKVPIHELKYLNIRSPIKPIRAQELADFT